MSQNWVYFRTKAYSLVCDMVSIAIVPQKKKRNVSDDDEHKCVFSRIEQSFPCFEEKCSIIASSFIINFPLLNIVTWYRSVAKQGFVFLYFPFNVSCFFFILILWLNLEMLELYVALMPRLRNKWFCIGGATWRALLCLQKYFGKRERKKGCIDLILIIIILILIEVCSGRASFFCIMQGVADFKL